MSTTNVVITTTDAVVTTNISTGVTDAAQAGAVADLLTPLEEKTDLVFSELFTTPDVLTMASTSGSSDVATLYIPNTSPLDKGYYYINYLVKTITTGYIFLVERIGTNVEIKKTMIVTPSATNTVLPTSKGFIAEGNRNESIGFYNLSVGFDYGGAFGMYSKGNYSIGTNLFTVLDQTNLSFYFSISSNESVSNIDSILSYVDKQIDSVKKDAPILDIGISPMLRYQSCEPNYDGFDNTYFLNRWFKRSISGVDYMVAITTGSEIYAKISNTTTLKCLMKNLSSSGNNPYIAVSIDGGAYTRFQVIDTEMTLASGLSLSEHYVRIVVSGLYIADAKWSSYIGCAFKSLSGDSGAIISPVKPMNPYITFIGDSITAGLNIAGVGGLSVNNIAEQAFSYLTAKNLNMVQLNAGYSSCGITTIGAGGVPVTIDNIDFDANGIADSSQTSSFVVVNIGTNDNSATDAVFTTGYTDLINRLLIKYPGQFIFAMRPFNGTKGTQIQAVSANYPNVFYVDTTGWGVSMPNASHPDAAGSITASTKLTEFIRTKLGN